MPTEKEYRQRYTERPGVPLITGIFIYAYNRFRIACDSARCLQTSHRGYGVVRLTQRNQACEREALAEIVGDTRSRRDGAFSARKTPEFKLSILILLCGMLLHLA